jgi:hypothetical protein
VPAAPGLRDWRLWADATCAGLSVLIPLPVVDLAFESLFRRRIPRAVARVRGVTLSPAAARRLGQLRFDLVGGCLAVPFVVILWILKRVFRKLLYVLTVADAVDALSAYWHRAFLIDHLVRSGHLGADADLDRVGKVFDEVLAAADVSGVKGLARQVVAATGHVPRLLRRARRRGAEEATGAIRGMVDAHWQVLDTSLRAVAAAFDRRWAEATSASETVAPPS